MLQKLAIMFCICFLFFAISHMLMQKDSFIGVLTVSSFIGIIIGGLTSIIALWVATTLSIINKEFFSSKMALVIISLVFCVLLLWFFSKYVKYKELEIFFTIILVSIEMLIGVFYTSVLITAIVFFPFYQVLKTSNLGKENSRLKVVFVVLALFFCFLNNLKYLTL